MEEDNVPHCSVKSLVFFGCEPIDSKISVWFNQEAIYFQSWYMSVMLQHQWQLILLRGWDQLTFRVWYCHFQQLLSLGFLNAAGHCAGVCILAWEIKLLQLAGNYCLHAEIQGKSSGFICCLSVQHHLPDCFGFPLSEVEYSRNGSYYKLGCDGLLPLSPFFFLWWHQ